MLGCIVAILYGNVWLTLQRCRRRRQPPPVSSFLPLAASLTDGDGGASGCREVKELVTIEKETNDTTEKPTDWTQRHKTNVFPLTQPDPNPSFLQPANQNHYHHQQQIHPRQQQQQQHQQQSQPEEQEGEFFDFSRPSSSLPSTNTMTATTVLPCSSGSSSTATLILETFVESCVKCGSGPACYAAGRIEEHEVTSMPSICCDLCQDPKTLLRDLKQFEAVTDDFLSLLEKPQRVLDVVLLSPFGCLSLGGGVEERFVPGLDILRFAIPKRPIATTCRFNIHLAQFRSRMWVVVVSKAKSRQRRTREVLTLVHARKSLCDSTDAELSRKRMCCALLDVDTHEVFGLAALHGSSGIIGHNGNMRSSLEALLKASPNGFPWLTDMET